MATRPTGAFLLPRKSCVCVRVRVEDGGEVVSMSVSTVVAEAASLSSGGLLRAVELALLVGVDRHRP
jgi:hypothetical protein